MRRHQSVTHVTPDQLWVAVFRSAGARPTGKFADICIIDPSMEKTLTMADLPGALIKAFGRAVRAAPNPAE